MMKNIIFIYNINFLYHNKEKLITLFIEIFSNIGYKHFLEYIIYKI